MRLLLLFAPAAAGLSLATGPFAARKHSPVMVEATPGVLPLVAAKPQDGKHQSVLRRVMCAVRVKKCDDGCYIPNIFKDAFSNTRGGWPGRAHIARETPAMPKDDLISDADDIADIFCALTA